MRASERAERGNCARKLRLGMRVWYKVWAVSNRAGGSRAHIWSVLLRGAQDSRLMYLRVVRWPTSDRVSHWPDPFIRLIVCWLFTDVEAEHQVCLAGGFGGFISSVDQYINVELIFHWGLKTDASFIMFQVAQDGFCPLLGLRLNKGSRSLSECDWRALDYTFRLTP